MKFGKSDEKLIVWRSELVIYIYLEELLRLPKLNQYETAGEKIFDYSDRNAKTRVSRF